MKGMLAGLAAELLGQSGKRKEQRRAIRQRIIMPRLREFNRRQVQLEMAYEIIALVQSPLNTLLGVLTMGATTKAKAQVIADRFLMPASRAIFDGKDAKRTLKRTIRDILGVI